MRVLLWHGWLLEGSGSNVYTARTAEAMRAAGHDVALVCQERHAERFPFVDAAGTVDVDGVSLPTATGATPAAGRLVMLRPVIGDLLPVFVVDDYEGFSDVRRFVDLDDDALSGYLERNVAALEHAIDWHGTDVVVSGHAIPGSVVASRALQRARRSIPLIAKIHGSDLEYAIREQRRYRELAAEGLARATAVAGATRDVLERTVALVPEAAGKTVVVPPGVDVDRFTPRRRRDALAAAARAIDGAAPDGGRPRSVDDDVRAALARRDAGALERLSAGYDQDAPDAGAASRVRALANESGPLVGYLGKLIPQKGVHDLLLAVTRLRHDVRIVVVGFGGFREWLTALTIALRDGDADGLRWLRDAWPEPLDAPAGGNAGNAARVSWTGRLDHRFAPEVVSALDVLVVPSILPEAFGMVAAEGAAAGALPIVARHSGLAEVAAALEDAAGRPGLFSYAPGLGASGRIAEAIDRLLDLPGRDRERLRGAVRRFVVREWTWERTASRLLDGAAVGA